MRARTFAEKTLNISYAKIDVEKEYGYIDEKMWEEIDELRQKDNDIGFIQKEFIYWKPLWTSAAGNFFKFDLFFSIYRN